MSSSILENANRWKQRMKQNARPQETTTTTTSSTVPPPSPMPLESQKFLTHAKESAKASVVPLTIAQLLNIQPNDDLHWSLTGGIQPQHIEIVGILQTTQQKEQEWEIEVCDPWMRTSHPLLCRCEANKQIDITTGTVRLIGNLHFETDILESGDESSPKPIFRFWHIEVLSSLSDTYLHSQRAILARLDRESLLLRQKLESHMASFA